MSALEIRNLCKSFGGLEVIANLNLEIPEGQRHAVIGPNGAGKTTLFNLITGWQPPTRGEILVDGVPVKQGRPDIIARSGLSRSFQKNMLLESVTVLENLRVACQALHSSRYSFLRSRSSFPDVLAKARSAAEMMHLDACLHRNVNELSYGQKRQLEVAIALCAEPKILLMDEPAAGTSPDERMALIQLINGLPRDLTIVLVEHDMDVVFAICDVITVLSYGKVLATGTKEQIQSNSPGDRSLSRTAPCLRSATSTLTTARAISFRASVSRSRRLSASLFRPQWSREDHDSTLDSGLDAGARHGRITFNGVDITRQSTFRIVRSGIAFVPEDRGIFPTVTVEKSIWRLRALRRSIGPRESRRIMCSMCSRVLRSVVTAWAASYPAANSRCWQSAAH